MTALSSRYTYEGTETTETSITRVGSALDPTGSAQSRKIITTANSQWLRPFKAAPYVVWNGVTNTDVTATVYGVVNAGALPNNDDVWMDVEYLTLKSQTNSTQLDGTPTGTVVMSNGNLTATHNDVSSNVGVISTTYLTAGKYYFEIATVNCNTSVASIGLMLSGGTIVNFGSGIDCVGCSNLNNTTNVSSNNTTWGNLGTTANGDIFCFAVDLTARLAWVRRNGGNWNANASADPATGIGGAAVAAGAFAPAVRFSSSSVATCAMTMNFGATAYAFTAPSGFGNWLSAPAPLGKIVTTTKVDLLATGTSVTSDSSSWSGIPVLTTFDGVPTASVVVSNGNLTVTHGAVVNLSGVTSTKFLTDGKYYFEVTVGQAQVGHASGIILSTGTMTDLQTFGTNCTKVTTTGGVIHSNNANTGKNVGTTVAGDVYGFAIDLTNRLAWIRRNAGNWNGDAAANPVTSAGGVTIAPGAFAPVVNFSASGLASDNMTGNFGQSAYVNAAPSGFVAWNSNWTSFKLTTTLSSPQPSYAGYIEARVRAAKASATYYVDPTIELSPITPTVGAATVNNTSRYTYEGTETTETSITRVNGAADPIGNRQSRKIVTTANSQWLRPFKVEPYAQWSNVTGADVSVTVCGTVNSGALPLNDEIWMDVEYLTLKSQPNPTQFDGIPSAGIVMSNGNLTVTHGTTTSNTGVTSTTYLSSGKYYFEITVGQAANLDAWGLLLSTGVISDMAGSTNSVMFQQGTSVSSLHSNNGNQARDIGAAASGDKICFAIDLTARLAWIRRNNGNWNADAAANPATGTGGLIIGAGTFSPAVRFSNISATDNITANFGATSYAYTPPSGFGNWISASAPLGKVVTTTKANVLAAGTSVTSDSSTWNVSSFTSFNLFDATANITLSNNNLTVTTSTGSNGVRAVNSYNSGKFYFEYTMAVWGINTTAIGLSLATGTLNSTSGTGKATVQSTGAINVNGVATGMTLNTRASGDIIGIAVDFTAQRIWFRVAPSGNWNGSGTANPATNTGGADISPIAGPLFPLAFLNAAGETVTANFGATTFSGAVPSGFTVGWLTSWSPFKLTTTLSSPQPGVAGYIHVRPRVAKASSTFYIDPQINLS